MRRRALVLALVAAAAGGGSAAASAAMDGMHGDAMTTPDATHVSIGFDSFAPPRVDVLAGDTVTWANDSVRAHTVTATDGSWDSQRLGAGEGYTHRFDAPGTVGYYCSLHPFMRGEVDAHELLLDQPGGPAGRGRSFPIAGRAALPSGTAVAVERDEGSGFARIATATVGPDGRFTAMVRPRTTASYRAVAGDHASPPVQVLVLDHRVRTAVTRGVRRVEIAVTVTPAAPGSTVVLQLHLRDRFGWWPVERARLDRASRARFVLRPRRRVPARVLLTLPDGATSLATSPGIRIDSAARVPKPARR